MNQEWEHSLSPNTAHKTSPSNTSRQLKCCICPETIYASLLHAPPCETVGKLEHPRARPCSTAQSIVGPAATRATTLYIIDQIVLELQELVNPSFNKKPSNCVLLPPPKSDAMNRRPTEMKSFTDENSIEVTNGNSKTITDRDDAALARVGKKPVLKVGRSIDGQERKRS